MKTWLRRVHLILALVSAIFIVNLSVTGAFLVFGKDIQAWLNPQYWSVQPTQIADVLPIPLPVSQLAEQVYQTTHSPIVFIEQDKSPFRAWQVRLADKSYVSINQYNADVMLHYQYDETFYGFTMAWHRWLLYTADDARPFALLPPIATLIMCGELLLGLYLWVRPKNRLKRLNVKWKAKNKIRFMQLHNVLGVYSLLPLFLIGFSGLAFYFKDETQVIVETLTFSSVQTPQPTNVLSDNQTFSQRNLWNNSSNEQYQLDAAVKSAQAELPGGWMYRVYLPQTRNAPLKLRIRMPNESHAYSYSWSNVSTGQAIESFDASETSLATRVWNFKYAFHIGDFIALPIKFMWLILSLLPLFFVGSGIYLFFIRRRAKKDKLTTQKNKRIRTINGATR